MSEKKGKTLRGRNRIQKAEVCYAMVKTSPVLFSYLFLSIAFGILMQEAGASALWAVLASLLVYTGAFQFVLVSFISGGASLLTVALTALAINSRHIFYGVSFVETFREMKKRYPYMIFSLTDETYALSCSLETPEGMDRKNLLFLIAVSCHGYWVFGTFLGALIGQYIPFDFTGIDFCMTAMFVTIFLDQWKQAKSHIPAVAGLASSILFLVLLGKSRFILPALCLATAIMLAFRTKVEAKENENVEESAGKGGNEKAEELIGKKGNGTAEMMRVEHAEEEGAGV